MSPWIHWSPWIWKRFFFFWKWREGVTELHGATTQNIWFLIIHAVETSDHCYISDYFVFFVYWVLLMHGWFSMRECNDKDFRNIWTSFAVNTQYHFERKGNWGYCWVLNVGIKNPKNMASFTAGSLCCGASASGPGRRYRHIWPVFIYCTGTPRRFQVGVWWNRVRHGRIVRY
jgi:hypothetical protein